MKRPNGRLKLMRRNNRAQIILGVQRLGPISRAELAKVTGLSKPCVSGIVDELIDERTLVETGTAATPRGRPLMLLDINPAGEPIAGVYIAPEAVEVALANPKLEIVARRTIPYNASSDDPELVIRNIARNIRHCVRAAGLDNRPVKAVGVSVAGKVDSRTGEILVMGNRPGWENVHIARMLEEDLGAQVAVENDIKAGALVREWFSTREHDGNAMYVLVCEGIGAAITYGEGLLRGERDLAGLFEHLIMEFDGSVSDFSYSGSLECLASDLAFIRRIWPDIAKKAVDMTVAQRNSLVQKGVRMALQGDERASQALKTTTLYLGIAIANAQIMMDPQVIFICGSLVDAAPDVVCEMIRKEALGRMCKYILGAEIRALRDYLVSGKIKKAHCVDPLLLHRLYPDRTRRLAKAPTREGCGCCECTDIGAYDTCPHGCTYCYANSRPQIATRNYEKHDRLSDILGANYETHSPARSGS